MWHKKIHSQWLILLVWIALGLSLRLTNLTAKPPWIDEFATLVFSLGNSFKVVPLDRAIATDVLLQPLQVNPGAGIADVIHTLLTEDIHPPLYFILAHLWMKLFPSDGGFVSLFAGRSLPALFGAISIPCVYALGRLAFRSRLVGQLAAAMMAVSPYGIFMAQEARHYTLVMLWVIASCACLVIATRHIQNRTQLPLWIGISWVVINALGVATHYFFTLTLCAEAVALILVAWRVQSGGQGGSVASSSLSSPSPPLPISPSPWYPIYAVAIGTFLVSIVWLPVFLQNKSGGPLTEWIQGSRQGIAWISPIFQALAAWITMIYLLPVESPNLAIMIASGLVMLVLLIWGAPILTRGLKIQLKHSENGLMTQVLAGVVVSAIALFFIFTYFLGIDLTRGARYNFVYFPIAIVLVGASLAVCRKTPYVGFTKISGKKAVEIILSLGFVSAITVVSNLGYQKYYRPDLFLPVIQQNSQSPVLIATTHKTLAQTGEMMGLAREFKTQNSTPPLFFLAHQDKNSQTSTTTLQNTLKELPRPLDLWLVNFHAPIPEEVKNCVTQTKSLPAINGYEYKLYHCRKN
ncbi:MAG: glycosyltransferase [Cyanomargarita calcarea GSE-NOS-MK-12-04C]|jgi:uncharacterized membrane protein|uniref:Glycosyltransferase n=1 Tax=Cyanomargarita calcarea GSE-NOS-MK-12-04C TaxID=2839659 RepID=A0A951UUD2_9CYAN|nr:glycosyltransferase [Cyanomargarita calcarea GSE-NOS-MK-12-04C]